MKKGTVIGIIIGLVLLIVIGSYIIIGVSEDSKIIDEYNKNAELVRADSYEIGNIATKIATLGEQMSKGVEISVSDLQDVSNQLTQKCDSSKPDFDRYKSFVNANKQLLDNSNVDTFDAIKAVDDMIVICQIQTKAINDAIKTLS